MNTPGRLLNFFQLRLLSRMKPKAAYACCSQFRKARRGKWKLSSGWAAKRWLWLPCRVNATPSFFCLRVWTSVCMAVLELLRPFSSLLAAWEAGLPWTTPAIGSSAAPSPRWVWTVVIGHRSGLRERLKCLRLCFLLGNHLGLVCPSAGHYPPREACRVASTLGLLLAPGFPHGPLPLTPFIGKLCGCPIWTCHLFPVGILTDKLVFYKYETCSVEWFIICCVIWDTENASL